MIKGFTILSVIFVPFILLFLLYPNPKTSHSSEHSEHVVFVKNKTTISATIATQGEGKAITIFGYTSPHATVTVSGVGIADITLADETGFFRFIQTMVYKNTKEVCLYAKDTDGR